MWQHPCWKILGIEATDQIKDIKRAYAKRSKEIHPEDHPEEFIQLHDAYEQAIAIAKHQYISTHQQTAPIIEEPFIESNVDQSKGYDFDALFEEANHLNQQQKEKLRTTVLEKISVLLNKMTSYTKWLKFTQESDFIQIAQDPIFLDELYRLISKRTISSEANTAFYKFYKEIKEPSQDIKDLLNLLDRQMQNKKDKAAKNFHNIRIIVLVAVFLIFSYIAWQCKSLAMMMVLILIGITLIYLSFISHRKRNKIKIILMVVIFFTLLFKAKDIYIYQNNHTIEQTIHEKYGDRVRMENKVDTDNPLYKDTSIYKCYDEENDITFYLKETKDDQGKTVFEDTFSGAFVTSMNINFTTHQKYTYPVNRRYDNVDGLDIEVTAENGDAMAKELYLLIHNVYDSPFYEQCKNFRFYAIPEHAKFAHDTRYSKTIEELSKLNVKEIKDWMFFSITAYRLDFTLWQPDKYQEDVQQYLHDASGIDILGKHYSDVHVEDDKLSIGNFYRLAIHLDLNIKKLDDDSLVWYTKNRTQMMGSGVHSPYIDVSLVKELL